MVRKVLKHTDEVVSRSSDLPSEVLYGRAGFLYSLLYLRKNLGQESAPDSTMAAVVASIIQSGLSYSKKVCNKTMPQPFYSRVQFHLWELAMQYR